MGNQLEQDIIELYSSNTSSLYSINQIATLLGKKYPYINKKVTLLVKSQIFRKIIVGRSHLCSLNLKNDETIYLLILNDIHKKKKYVESSQKASQISEYASKIARLSGTPLVLKRKNSILFIVDSEDGKQSLEKSMLSTALQGSEHTILTRDEFLKLLKEDKALHEERIILFGFENYYECIREIEDELKIRYSKVI